MRVTARFDDDQLELFKKSVKELGAVAPIICVEVDSSKLWPDESDRSENSQYILQDGNVLVLVDGLHRLTEAINNKAEYIDVVVTPGDMVDVLTRNIFVDHLRGKTPVSEMRTVLEALYKEYHMTVEEISKRCALPMPYVEKILLINELTPFCLRALDEGRVTVSHASALARVKDPIRQETIMGQQLLYHWPVKELERYIREVEELVQGQTSQPVATEPVAIHKPRCFYCGEEHEPAEIANPNTCRYCSATLLSAMRQAERELEDETHTIPSTTEDKNTKTEDVGTSDIEP